MKNIGLVSDLHLESTNIELPNPGWDYLVIAGDLSADLKAMQHFFTFYAPQDIPIIYVLGNHEYEGRRLDSAADKIRELIRPFENVTLLDNESLIIDDIKFIGSTLWSNFELDGINEKEKAMKWAKFNVIDFTAISYKAENGLYRPINPEQMVELNRKACEYLKFELTKVPFDGTKVVVSHFAPHKNSIHSSRKNQECSYWVNNLEELLGFSDYWFHGHTHSSLDYTIEGTRVICNPRGHSKMFNMSSNVFFNKELMVPAHIIQEDDIYSPLTKSKKL